MLPLKLQGLALQNEQARLEIQQQAMGNDIAGIELNQYKTELPVVYDWLKNTSGDPLKVLNDPTPNVASPKLQGMILNAKKMAAQNTYAQQVEKYQIGLTEAAAKLLSKGKYVEPKVGANGREYFDPQDIALAAEELEESDRVFVLERIAAQTAWHGSPSQSVEPQVQVVGGEVFVVNPKSGHFERLSKAPSREQFLTSNLSKWASDNMVTPDVAAQQLGEVYDKFITKSTGSAAAPSPVGAPTEKVMVRGKDGKLYRLPKSQLEEAIRQGYKPE